MFNYWRFTTTILSHPYNFLAPHSKCRSLYGSWIKAILGYEECLCNKLLESREDPFYMDVTLFACLSFQQFGVCWEKVMHSSHPWTSLPSTVANIGDNTYCFLSALSVLDTALSTWHAFSLNCYCETGASWSLKLVIVFLYHRRGSWGTGLCNSRGHRLNSKIGIRGQAISLQGHSSNVHVEY